MQLSIRSLHVGSALAATRLATPGVRRCLARPNSVHCQNPSFSHRGQAFASFALPDAVADAVRQFSRPERVHNVFNPRLVGSEGWVSDIGHLLSETDRIKIDAVCREIHQSWRAEVVVVVLESLPTGFNPAGFAAALLNYWGVGDAKLHTGLVVLLLVKQRRLEMRTGFGATRMLGADTLESLQNDRMVPLLKLENPGGALLEGLKGIQEIIDHTGPSHWRRSSASEPNRHGFGGGQTPIDEFKT
uniref:TPM domain-containing protein n=1 Tax=Noctiluca scintillans TaxID=2966 RepID=A0A7S1F1T3_NOCSC|mmetsp:Transcript_2529/g.7499  ORF Transcript_2529/g.7499 Transcript_2529/m.7499 type:complete len:245 (+) Transcript_2529:50-784(+)